METIQLLLDGEYEEASMRVGINSINGSILLEIIDNIIVIEVFSTNKAQELYADSLRNRKHTLLLLLIVISGIIILVSVILGFLRKSILPPINNLKDALDHFKQGNLEIRSLNISKNELGIISNSFNQMTERIEKDNCEKVTKAAELITAQAEITSQAELIKIQAAYHIEKQLFQATLASIGDAVISCDTNSHIMFMNKIAEKLTGWKQEEAIGCKIEDVFHIANELTYEKSENIVEKVILSGEIAELENHTVLIRRDGTNTPIEDSAAPIFQEDLKIIGAVLVFRDVTDKRERLRSIEYLSYHDELTGLYNRRFYEEEMKRLDTERNLPLTIVMGDVNGLKLVNDSLGHIAGDELLCKVANAIKHGSRSDDIVARLGGDEFIAILPNTSTAEADKIVKRIKNLASKEEVNKLPISISFGHGTKKEKTQDIQEVFKTAENNMYRQKLSESASMRSKTVDIIMKTLYEKNIREMLHSKRVSELCEACARKMNFDEAMINQTKLAGLMHDIGKIGINEEIVNKTNHITKEEYEEIKKHAAIGYRVLNSVQEFSEIALFVLNHHERWDGTGYPKGLKGEEISVPGRIIALADAYDAMMKERTYKRTLNKEEAISEIKKCAGSQFDPAIAETFIRMILEEME